jgi:predicted DCC family thiol-disulfide oxidoreductase YuxK
MNGPVEVYYDRSCAMCRGEVEALAAADADGRLRLHDCSAPGFDDEASKREGVDRGHMMRAMHVRDADGRWHRGVDAFVVMYRAAGLDALAAIWAHRWLKPAWERLYPLVAKHRRVLDRLGAPRLVRFLLRHATERAARNRARS